MKLQDAGMLRNMLSSGLSMGFMSSLVNIGTLTLQTSINKLGQNIIIAHTAARKISEIFMIMFSVFGQTMATYCGQIWEPENRTDPQRNPVGNRLYLHLVYA